MSQCWAYNTDRLRCQLDAGHEEPHTIYTTWRDDQCYEPDKSLHTLMQPVATAGDSGAGTIKALPPFAEPASCVACKHMHKGGVCKCGCHEHIG